MKTPFTLLLLLVLLKLHAQCEENFENTLLDSNWNTSQSAFIINSNEQLQLQSTSSGYAFATWDIGECFNDAVEWRFYIKQGFAGSTNNYSKIYLSNSPITDSVGHDESSLHPGYLIRFGTSGSTDFIEFLRDDGWGTLTPLMSGFNIANGINGWIKISKSNGYQLFFMDNDSTDYTLIGSTEDSTYQNFQHLSWLCHFTSSNSQNFYLDECYSGAIYTAPIPYDPFFREIVINEIMADPSPSNGLPEIEYVELYNNSTHSISLDNWQWVNSTSIKPIPFGSIDSNGYVILCDLSAVFNFTGNVIGIESFGLLTNGGDSLSLLSPDGELIDFVVPQLNCSDHFNWKQSCYYLGGTPGFQNCQFSNAPLEEPLVLEDYGIDTLGNVFLWTNRPIHQDSIVVEYQEIKHSLELFHLSDSAWFNAASWMDNRMSDLTIHRLAGCLEDSTQDIIIAIGLPQSCQENEIHLTEVLSHPFENGESFVELYNNSDKIITLDGLYIENNNEEQNGIQGHHHFIAPFTAVCISENPQLVSLQYPLSFGNETKHHRANLPYLTQSTGSVHLKNRRKKEMDSMLYDEDHHHPIIHDPQGVSFERIQIPCPQNDHCWTSGSAHYGFATPGFYLQADPSENHPIDDHWEISSSWFSPNNDTRDDHLFIRWNGAQENHLLNIHVYSIDGSLVLPIANHELNLQAAALSCRSVFSLDEQSIPNIKKKGDHQKHCTFALNDVLSQNTSNYQSHCTSFYLAHT